jgi:hypothetical protein
MVMSGKLKAVGKSSVNPGFLLISTASYWLRSNKALAKLIRSSSVGFYRS